MKALDLYCGAGGVTKGLQRAGYQVTGVDIKPQPRYCGEMFLQADALASGLDLSRFDFIWASPPCQAHSTMKTMHNAKEHVDLIAQTRDLLTSSGRPWAMENVPGAPLKSEIVLCGTMFRLGTDDAELRRHRHFETSWEIPWYMRQACQHLKKPSVIGVYGGHVRNRRRREGSHARGVEDFPVSAGHTAMGIDWMTLTELSQAIPPAYAEFIAKTYLTLQRKAA